MINVYSIRSGAMQLIPIEPPQPLPADAVWIDLDHPTPGEERYIEQNVRLDVPTREEMTQLEVSRRLYEERGAVYLTLVVVWRSESVRPIDTDITFVVRPESLITVRYADPRPFQTFAQRACKGPWVGQRGDLALVALVETIVERAADILERISANLDRLSQSIFGQTQAESGEPTSGSHPDLQQVLVQIGQERDLASKLRESLHSIARAVPYFESAAAEWLQPSLKSRLSTLRHDVLALNEQNVFLTSKADFLLSATLGLINIEQNAIIKIFSVVAVIFMPPTLVASIYGMNFRHMPELDCLLGYPLAIVLMVGAAVLPYWFFKRRRWL